MMTQIPLRSIAIGACALVLGAAPAAAQATQERGVFVTQIGDANRADVTQRNSESLARIAQNGDDNVVELTQQGSGAHSARIAQNGGGNSLAAMQDGPGEVRFALAQEGDGNVVIAGQRESSAIAASAATLFQTGNDNSIILVQDGSDNEVLLSQTGNGNEMTVTQENSGNRLEWSQNGDDLPDLEILQQGNQAMQITQSMTGAVFAPPPGGG